MVCSLCSIGNLSCPLHLGLILGSAGLAHLAAAGGCQVLHARRDALLQVNYSSQLVFQSKLLHPGILLAHHAHPAAIVILTSASIFGAPLPSFHCDLVMVLKKVVIVFSFSWLATSQALKELSLCLL